jgi:hypothetical protein
MPQRTRSRILTIAFAPAAALATWALIRLAGIDLVLAHDNGRTVGPLNVFGAALAGGLAGWLVVLWIERHSRRPRRLWAQVGSMTLAVSVVLGPSRLADGASAVALIGLHVVTAAVVIAGFSRTLPATPGDCAQCVLRAPRWMRRVGA